ncbi:MAG: hypothetical protein WDN25_15170 [Acetobacteraceae bacterium]
MTAFPLVGRLALIMIVVTGVACGVSIALSVVTWRHMLYDEAYASCRATAADLAQVIEQNMDLGVPLAMLGNTQQLIERSRRANPSIAHIAVLDTQGVTLFDTEPWRVGDDAPREWRPRIASETVWSGTWEDTLLAGNLVRNDLRRPIGSIVVLYNADEIRAKLSTALLEMVRFGVLLLLLVIILAALLSSALLRELRRWSRTILEAVDADGPVGRDPPPPDTPLVHALHAAKGALRRSEQELMRLGTTDDERV